MPITLEDLAKQLVPKKSVLLFGAGSSIPSGAPRVSKLLDELSSKFGVALSDYSLSEMASFCEARADRSQVVEVVRQLFKGLKPTGGLKNLPLYEWKSIFTTNYDNLIEQAFELRGRRLRVYHSNFNFTTEEDDPDCSLFKLHGTIERDICDGDHSRLIISEQDFQQTSKYREYLYDRLKGDMAGGRLLIVGHSLSDPDIRSIVNRALDIAADILNPPTVFLLMYSPDGERAALLEKRGIHVAFGGIDELFAALSKVPVEVEPTNTASPTYLDCVPALVPVTIDIVHSTGLESDISAMFNGHPAGYAEIQSGFTFARVVASNMAQHLDEGGSCAILLGASGVGKTTAARQTMLLLQSKGIECFEHNGDHALSAKSWLDMANRLREDRKIGILLVDDAHVQLQQINDLVDGLVKNDNGHLKLIISSSKNHWYPRIKTPNLFKFGKAFILSKLENQEIESLIDLLDNSDAVRSLVEDHFSGFNREERRRRLSIRCEADMFVCLKNIFANDSFDNIVLREFADLTVPLQEIYKLVAAMETAGVRVHRQLVIRLLGVPAGQISNILSNLEDIVTEYSVDERFGIFGWRSRHSVIAAIVTKYKYSDLEKTIDLFDKVIEGISPTYDIEIRSLRELCNVETGIARIPDKNVQNRLLRKMMSNAPGERVPRHRLIRNLIEQGSFEKAETEIRLFDKDFGSDGPVHRYKVKLLVGRATRTQGLLREDRIAILDEGRELALRGISRYPINKNILSAYAELGLEYYRLTGRYDYFDDAIRSLESAEEQLGDPQISSVIAHFQRRIAGQPLPQAEVEEDTSAVSD